MKVKVFELTFIPVAISMFCGLLIAVNEAIPVLPVWPIWGLFIVSTIAAFIVISSVLTIGFVQWIMQRMSRHAI